MSPVKLPKNAEIFGISQIWEIAQKSGQFPRFLGYFPDFWEFAHFLDRYLVFFRSEVDAESPTEHRQIKIGRVWGTIEKGMEEMAADPVQKMTKSKSGKFPKSGQHPKKWKWTSKWNISANCWAKITKFAANSACMQYLCVRFRAFARSKGGGLGIAPHGTWGLGCGHRRSWRVRLGRTFRLRDLYQTRN